MGSQQAMDALHAIITAHARSDYYGFEKAIETLIRQLSVENRPGEAKSLRDALELSRRTVNGRLSPLAKPNSPLISFPKQPDGSPLVFSPKTKQSLVAVVEEHRAVHRLGEAGLKPKTKLLFWGPPGCGKTASAFWLGSQLGIPVGVVRIGTLITSYVGETGSNIQKVFSLAEQNPMVLLLDEADAIAKSRDDENDVGELRRVVNALLQGLDQFTSDKSIAVFATNHAFLFDSALWRRFDDIVEFPLPNKQQRIEFLKQATSGLRIKGSVGRAAGALNGRSFDDLRRAVLAVAKSVVLHGEREITDAALIAEAKAWSAKVTSGHNRPRKR